MKRYSVIFCFAVTFIIGGTTLLSAQTDRWLESGNRNINFRDANGVTVNNFYHNDATEAIFSSTPDGINPVKSTIKNYWVTRQGLMAEKKINSGGPVVVENV